MPQYLTWHEYGQGAIWLYVEAENPAQITETYRDLRVFEAPPAWWTEEMKNAARANRGPIWVKWLTQFRR